MVKGTKAEDVIEILKNIPFKFRQKVTEVTMDMANSMNKNIKRCFPNAVKVIDRFHVQKLAYQALQDIRIKHRCEAINAETNAIQKSRADKREHKPITLKNGDTLKELRITLQTLWRGIPQQPTNAIDQFLEAFTLKDGVRKNMVGGSALQVNSRSLPRWRR